MSAFDALRHRLRVLLRPGAYGRELDDEARFHLELEEMQQAHLSRGGGSPEDARLAARRRFGNVTRHVEARREAAGLGFLDVMSQDVRFALRSFRRTPAFTAVAVITLAIGIGANTAIFSAVDALLLRPLPFAEPDRLMKLSLTRSAVGDTPANDDVVWSYPKYVVLRDAQTVFSDLALWTDWQFTLRAGAEADRVSGEIVAGRYLPTLGIRPALGRDFTIDEGRTPGAAKVALIGDALWRRAYDADPAALGQPVRLGRETYTIVGVLPAGFRGVSGRAEVWVPMMAGDREMLTQPWSHSYWLVGRLKDGVTPARAKTEVTQIGKRVEETYPHPEIRTLSGGAVARELDATRADPTVRRSLLVLLGAVGLVLLIACANVANLFLVRAASRRREIAVRLAVGAGRRRIVRQLLTESLLLAVAGAAAGVLVAFWSIRALTALAPAAIRDMQVMSGIGAVNFESVRLDGAALAFTAALALATGLLFGLVPALQATRPSLAPALKGDADPGRARRLRGRNALVVGEIALALVLLAGSGLMLRSLGKLLGVNPGFEAGQVLTLRFVTGGGYEPDSLPRVYDRILERIEALPGVTAAGLSDCPPLNGGCNGSVLWRRDRPPVPAGTEPEVGVHWISPGWAEAMRVPLLRGRMFDEREQRNGRKAVLVSRAAADRIWPGEDPIGRPVSVGQGGFDEDTAFVIGVLGDVRFVSVHEPPRPEVFLPYSQSPYGRTMLFVRTAGDPLALASTARQVVKGIAPEFVLFDVRTMEDRARQSIGHARFSTILLALFAALALGLATLGIYGVISFAVAQRTREIGIRVALGATRGRVVRDVVGQGATLALVGAALGLVAALAATRVLRSFLFDVAPTDPPTFIAIVALLGGAAIAASWIPARRAAGVQPTEALRGD